MKLLDYLAEVDHAVQAVIAVIHSEHQRHARLQLDLAALTAAMDDGYQRADFLALNPDLDDDGLGTAIHWETYFGPDRDRHRKAAEVKDTEKGLQLVASP